MKKLKKGKIQIASMRHETGSDLADKRIVDRLEFTGGEKIEAFTVREHENAILLQMGRSMGLVPSGLWEIDKKMRVPGTEVIWVDTTDFKVRWGMGNAYTSDNIKVGAHGEMVLHVSDANLFVSKVVSSKKTVERDQIEEFILGQINAVLRTHFHDYTIEKMLGERETFQNVARAKLYETFSQWGLEMVNLEVLGYNLPPEFDQMGTDKMRHARAMQGTSQAMELEKMKLQQQMELEKQKLELERMKREFSREQTVADGHTSNVVSGSAQSQAIDLEKKRMELERMRREMDRQDKAMKYDHKEKVVAIESGQKPAVAADPNAELRKKRDALEAKLDELEEKFDAGDISEEMYLMRAKRLQKKIAGIEKKL